MKQLDDNIIIKYLQKECSEEDFTVVGDWLRDSEDNAEKLFRLEESFDSFRLNRYSAPASLDKAARRLLDRIAQSENARKRKLQIRRFMQYAAMFAVVLAGLTIGRHLLDLSLTKSMNVTVSTTDTVREVNLPDGTKVWLNRLTELTYPKQFSTDSRTVYLTGEAYFVVSKDTVKPFFVHSDAMRVKVLGTTFNIKAEKDALLSETTLIEGKIEVTAEKCKGQVVLSPGQKAELNRETGALEVKQVDTCQQAVWRDGLIAFDHARINEIAAVLQRFYKVRVVLAPDIDTSTYSGVLHHRDNIEQVLDALKNTIPINYEIKGGILFVSASNS